MKKNIAKVIKNKPSFFKRYFYEILVFVFFVLIRLPSLGHDNFNTDVWKWKSRSYDFGNGVFDKRFDQTLQKYHPGVTLMWIGSIGAKINNYYAGFKGQSLVAGDDVEIIFQLDFIQKFLLVSVLGISTSLIFYVLRNTLGLKFSLLSIFMLSFEPFYLGLSRVFHLEGLVSTFMLASVVWLYYYFFDTKNKKRLVVAAVFSGLALLTKTSAVFLIPFFGLATLIHVYRNGKDGYAKGTEGKKFWINFWNYIKSFSSIYFLWFGVVVLVFFALWPALWVRPGLVFTTLYEGVADVGVEGEHFQYYFGKFVENPGPSFYFVVLGLKSSVYLLVGSVGALIVRKKLSENSRKFVDLLLLFIFFYFIQLTIPTKKLDRYILPALVMFSMLSSVFFIWVCEKIKFKKLWHRILSIYVFIVPMVLTVFYVHPDYLSYFNPMFGGLRTGVKVLEPKWLIGTNEIVEYFEEIRDKKGWSFSLGESFEDIVYKQHGKKLKTTMTVGFPEKYYTQIHPFFRERGMWAVVLNLYPFSTKTKYFIFPVWDDTSMLETKLKMSYFDTIKLRGVPVYNVYINEGEGVNVR